MAELCLQYDVLLIADEIHSDLVYEGSKHIPIASLSKEISAITITCTAPGKTFNISGLSIGFIIIENKEIRDKIYNIFSSRHMLASNIFGIEACRTAYEKGEQWLAEALSYLQSNRDFLVDYINNEIPLLEVFQPEGTYLAWIDFRNLKLSQSDLIYFLVFVAGLGLDNGGKFGDDGLGFMRLNFACSRILLKKALDSLAASIIKLIDVDLDIKKLIDKSEVIEDCG
jgi:cystathionine beta-lyase